MSTRFSCLQTLFLHIFSLSIDETNCRMHLRIKSYLYKGCFVKVDYIFKDAIINIPWLKCNVKVDACSGKPVTVNEGERRVPAVNRGITPHFYGN